MKLSRISGLLRAGALLALVSVSACGDDAAETVSSGSCTTVADCPDGRVCVDRLCVPISGSDVSVLEDVPSAPADTDDLTDLAAPNDITAPKDTKPPADPGPAPDLIPDKEAPTLKSTTPKAGAVAVAVPWSLLLTFSEPVKNVEDSTVEVTDTAGVPLKGTFTSDDAKTVWTFKPTGELAYASPYTAKINFPIQVIADMANNKMAGITEFQFFTAPPKDRENYAALARKYSPRLRVLTSAKPHYDYPAKIDLDGDLDLKNNKTYLDKATTNKLTPVVYWDALESESHTYIHYVWYHVGRTAEGDAFENEAAGALVVLEKFPTERPVEALVWFKKTGGDYVRAFATEESGILGGGALASEGLTAVFAQSALFPEGHIEVAIKEGGHEACLWLDEGNQAACHLPNGDRVIYEDFTVLLDAGDTASTIKKNGANWPRSNQAIGGSVGATVSYKLEDMLAIWWPYRTQTETLFNDSFAAYTFTVGGKTKAVEVPRYFLAADGSQSDGRAPWAVIWKPGDNTIYVDGLPAGQFFLDPAAHLAARHTTAYTEATFDATAKTGFSTAWCFNAYLGIDIRGTGDACPK